MIRDIFKKTYQMAKEACIHGMIDEETMAIASQLIPNCQHCGKKLWQDDCELSEDDKFCSIDCILEHLWATSEAEATGN